jgi:hypothetical protein
MMPLVRQGCCKMANKDEREENMNKDISELK